MNGITVTYQFLLGSWNRAH